MHRTIIYHLRPIARDLTCTARSPPPPLPMGTRSAISILGTLYRLSSHRIGGSGVLLSGHELELTLCRKSTRTFPLCAYLSANLFRLEAVLHDWWTTCDHLPTLLLEAEVNCFAPPIENVRPLHRHWEVVLVSRRRGFIE